MALTDIFKKKKAEGKKETPKKEAGLKLKKDSDKKKPAEVKKEPTLKPKKAEAKVVASKVAHQVLLRPVITEKAADLMGQNKYVFEVAIGTNKNEIKKAVASLYNVSPLNVQVMKQPGKKVQRGRIVGKRKTWKKAIVTLKKGEKIEIYEGV